MEGFILWVVMGVLCAFIAYLKNRNIIAWLILGVMFSIISLAVIIFLPRIEDTKDTFPCPFCKSPVKLDSIRCKHCESDL